jgi:hypothetical protein
MYLPSEIGEEIARRLPLREQARLSKKNKEIADRRKYESITYAITIEEIERYDDRSIIVVAGTPEKFVRTR